MERTSRWHVIRHRMRKREPHTRIDQIGLYASSVSSVPASRKADRIASLEMTNLGDDEAPYDFKAECTKMREIPKEVVWE